MKIDSSVMSQLTGTYQTALSGKQETAEAESFKSTLEKAATEKDMEKLKVASQEFEAYFVNTLFKEMRKTIEEGGLTEKSQARETFEGMLDEEMSKVISKKGGFGIADLIYENMSRVYGSKDVTEAEAILDFIGTTKDEKIEE